MGCLIESIFGIFIEAVLNLVISLYLKVAHIIVPHKEITQETKTKIKNIITVISLVLMLNLFVGVCFLMPPDSTIFKTIGIVMVSVSLLFIGLQIITGITLMIIRLLGCKKSEKPD